LFIILRCERKCFLKGFIFGFLANSGILWWVSTMLLEGVSRLLLLSGVILLVFYLSFYWGLIAILIYRLKKISKTFALFSFPFLWVSFEFLRSLTSQIGFPWGTLGYSLSIIPSMIQVASITGISGIGLLILLYNCLFYWSFTHNNWRKILVMLSIPLIIIMLQFFAGKMVMSANDRKGYVKVSLIQANILPDIKREYSKRERISILKEMSYAAKEHKPELMVWSETSIPCFYRESSECINKIKDIANQCDVPILAGAPEYIINIKERIRYMYNSAFLISAQGKTIGKYRKVYLVPFGEHLPFDNSFPGLKKIDLGQGEYMPGEEFTVFSLGEFKFSALICFEAIFPRLVRRMVNNGAELLVNITEDAWFGRTAGPYQHAEMAIMRAVENRISICRCGNSGVSMFVDPYGRILKKSKIFERTIVEGKIPLRKGRPFYTRFGDLFAWIVVGISAVLIIIAFSPLFKKETNYST
jgi:apolipoprotein N-acyltransferase